MLDEYKASYESLANKIDGWRKMDKNQIFFIGVQQKNDADRELYISAAICRYWSLIGKYVFKGCKQVSEDEVYNCLIDTVLYVFDNKIWEDPTHQLYGDKTAPDKQMNIKMYHNYCTLLQIKNEQKHKSNLPMNVVEQPEDLELSDTMDDILSDMHYDRVLQELVKNYEYSTAFIIYIILHMDTFVTKREDDKDKQEFSRKKLLWCIQRMSEDQVEHMSRTLGMDKDVAQALVDAHKAMRPEDLSELLQNNLSYLS